MVQEWYRWYFILGSLFVINSVFYSIKENVDYEELNDFSRFHRVFLNLLNIQAPLKKKILRGNNSPL